MTVTVQHQIHRLTPAHFREGRSIRQALTPLNHARQRRVMQIQKPEAVSVCIEPTLERIELFPAQAAGR